MRYINSFLAHDRATDLYRWLMKNANWRREDFVLFGKRQVVPRTTAWFGDMGLDYRYTGTSHAGHGWPDELSAVREQISFTAGASFNFVLLNHYADGSEYMGWHRDDERGCNGLIASLSLGGVREMAIEAADTQKQKVALHHGSLLLFDGRLRHRLCKTVKPVDARINLTFRILEH